MSFSPIPIRFVVNKKMTDPPKETGHPLVNKELAKFQQRKKELLSMKKSQRGDELKTVDEGIARMKRWNRELEATERQKKIEEAQRRIQGFQQKFAESCDHAVDSLKYMTEALGKINSGEKQRGVNPLKYK